MHIIAQPFSFLERKMLKHKGGSSLTNFYITGPCNRTGFVADYELHTALLPYELIYTHMYSRKTFQYKMPLYDGAIEKFLEHNTKGGQKGERTGKRRGKFKWKRLHFYTRKNFTIN